MSAAATSLTPVGSPPARPASRRLGWIAALLLLAIGSALRLNDVATLSVNGDEIYTIWETRSARTAAAQVDVATAWKQRAELMVKADPAPPPGLPQEELWRLRWGYRTNPLHLLLNEASFALFGDSPFAARLSSLACGLLALVLLPLLARGLWGDRFALLLLAVLALSPNAIEHARFARYYSASFLFGALAALAAARFTQHRRRRDEWLFAGSALLLVLVHSTGALVAGLLLLWMAFGARSKLAIACLALGAAAAAGLWWLGPLKKIVDTIGEGIRPTSVYRSWRMAAGLFYNVGPGLVALGAWSLACWPRRGQRLAQLPLALTVLLACWILFTLNYRHDIGPRYFAAIEGVGALLAACGLERLCAVEGRRRLAHAAAALLVAAQLPLLLSNAADGQRFPIAETVERLRLVAQPHDRVMANWGGIFEYHLERAGGPLRNVMELPNNLATLEERLLERRASDGTPPRAWLVLERQRGQLSWAGPSHRLVDWLAQHAQPVETFGTVRLDSLLNRFNAGYRYELALYEVDLAALRASKGG
ncbi:MAG: glycosyltransferase family 39 protein [Planctomycetes bacterium]|nr:glycosyltransferase family 39 protein [Planctomycetota bacterium]